MIENSVQHQSNNQKMFNQPKMFKKLEKIELKYTKIVFTFSDLGVGFFGAHHSFPIFMPFPKWYNTYSPHLTWRLSLFFRRVCNFDLFHKVLLTKLKWGITMIPSLYPYYCNPFVQNGGRNLSYNSPFMVDVFYQKM